MQKGKRVDDKQDFQWWFPYTLNKRDVILSAVKVRTKNSKVKYGIKVPRNCKEAKQFDDDTGSTFWKEAIDLEIDTIISAFDLVSGERPPLGYSEAYGHTIFDVKMDFIWKARFVMDGHLNSDPIDSIFLE